MTELVNVSEEELQKLKDATEHFSFREGFWDHARVSKSIKKNYVVVAYDEQAVFDAKHCQLINLIQIPCVWKEPSSVKDETNQTDLSKRELQMLIACMDNFPLRSDFWGCANITKRSKKSFMVEAYGSSAIFRTNGYYKI